MYFRAGFFGAAIMALPVAALAQGAPVFNGTATLTYSSGSISTIDVNTMRFGLTSDIVFSPNFELGFDAGFGMSDLSSGGTTVNVDTQRFAFEPRYNFGNGAYAGFYYHMSQVDLSISPIPISLGADLNSYGLFAGYETGSWNVEGFIGQSDTDPGLPSGFDITDMGLSAGFEVSPNFELFGTLARTSLGTPGTDVDLNLVAIGGEYDFQNGLSVFGSAGRIGVDFGGPDTNATQFALGVSYDLGTTGASIPAVVSLEVSQTNLSVSGLIDEDMTRWTLGVAIPIGGGQVKSTTGSGRVTRGEFRSVVHGLFAAGL